MKIKLFHALNKFFPLICLIICLCHYFFWLYICFPGVLYGDNMMMLAEALPGGGIGDQHSVMYIWFLKNFTRVFGYGLGYPLIWGLFFWYAGVCFFTLGLHNLFKNYLVLLFIAIFSYLPFINFVLPHIQLKDFNMSAVLLAGCGLLFLLSTCKSGIRKKIFLICVISVFFIAINFRHNAIFAFLPLSILLSVQILSEMPNRKNPLAKNSLFKILMISLTLIIGLFIGKSIFEKKVGDYENYFVHTSVFTFDLAGISVNLDRMEIPQQRLMEGITIDTLKKVFNTAGWDPLWGGWGSSPRIIKGGETEEEVSLWRTKWFFTVLDNPGTYLKHRSDHFNRFIASKNAYLCICEWPPEVGRSVLKSLLPPNLQSHADKYSLEDYKINGIDYLRKREEKNKLLEKEVCTIRSKEYNYGEWLFMDYPIKALRLLNYGVMISLFACILVWYRPRYFNVYQRKIIPLATAIFLSGWFYFTAYFFVSISSDWRYIHWSSLAFWLGASLMIIAAVGIQPYYFVAMKMKKIAVSRNIMRGRNKNRGGLEKLGQMS